MELYVWSDQVGGNVGYRRLRRELPVGLVLLDRARQPPQARVVGRVIRLEIEDGV